jgi:WD40 repeat protein
LIEEEYEHGDLKISKSGKYLVTTTIAGGVILWDTDLEKAIKFIENAAISADITIDEKQLIIATHNDVSKIVIYDLDKDEEIKSFGTSEINYLIKLSNSGKYLATGGIVKDHSKPNEFFDVLILWDTENWTIVKKLYNEIGNAGFRFIRFSNDDTYLTSVVNTNYEAQIYNLSDFSLVFSSNSEKNCFNICMLPDNLHFLVFYYDWDDLYELELYDLDKFIKGFDYATGVMDIKNVDQKDLMYFRSGKYSNRSYLVEVDLLNTVAEESENSFNVNYTNNQLLINFNEINFVEYKIEIFNISGTLVFSHNDSVPEFSKRLELPPGAFICKIIIGNKSYSQKFLVSGR